MLDEAARWDDLVTGLHPMSYLAKGVPARCLVSVGPTTTAKTSSEGWRLRLRPNTTLDGRLGDVFLLPSLRLLVLPEDGFDRLLTRGELGGYVHQFARLGGCIVSQFLTRSRQVVPVRNAPMTSESVMLGNSVHCFENRRMYSRRDSPGCWRQLRRSHEFPGHTYVPWKFPAKALTRSSQSKICAGGRCSSQVRAAPERKRGRLRMMRLSSSLPPN
jgi:hypothetical protein